MAFTVSVISYFNASDLEYAEFWVVLSTISVPYNLVNKSVPPLTALKLPPATVRTPEEFILALIPKASYASIKSPIVIPDVIVTL